MFLIQLLLMEHKLPSSSVSSVDADEHLNLSEKILASKYTNELSSTYYRDLSTSTFFVLTYALTYVPLFSSFDDAFIHLTTSETANVCGISLNK